MCYVCHNVQMNSIYDGKLPISRAKMASITRSAIKSLKVGCVGYLVVYHAHKVKGSALLCSCATCQCFNNNIWCGLVSETCNVGGSIVFDELD